MNSDPQLSVDAEMASLLHARIVHSERLRAGALMAITATFVALIVVVANVPGLLPPHPENRFYPALKVMAAVLVSMGVYEAVVWSLLGRWQRAAKPVPEVLGYVNAFIEIAFPTLIIWDWSSVAGPLQTVGGVLPWLYFPFIAASALHLNQRLCWFIGIVASLSFGIVTLMITRGVAAGDTPLLISPHLVWHQEFHAARLRCGGRVCRGSAPIPSAQRSQGCA
jgi:hypothetical protein